MRNRTLLSDLEIFVDPKPLTTEEKVALSKFIQEHKEINKIKSKRRIAA